MKSTGSAVLKSDVPIKKERRYFAESVRKSIVDEIDKGLSKAEAARKYEISETTIYKWVAKYSRHYQRLLVKVVEDASQSNKVRQLEAELERTYALLGRVKAESLLLQTIIEKADEAWKTDLKRLFRKVCQI